jgi:hypothetical protein
MTTSASGPGAGSETRSAEPDAGARKETTLMPLARRQQTAAPAQRGDRWLIFAQLLLGAALVVFGALLAALSKAAVHDIGTAVIGVGAALIPAGAAASASARINQTLVRPRDEDAEA